MLTIVVILFIFTAGYDVAIIIIGNQYTNTTCDEEFNHYRLSRWLVSFGIGNIVITMLLMPLFYFSRSIVRFIIKHPAKEEDEIVVSGSICIFCYTIESIIGIIWFLFTFIMTIIGIDELHNVHSNCIEEEYGLVAVCIATVVVHLFLMYSACCGCCYAIKK
jgi:hypothetical protein